MIVKLFNVVGIVVGVLLIMKGYDIDDGFRFSVGLIVLILNASNIIGGGK